MSFLDKLKKFLEEAPEPKAEKISNIGLSELPSKIESLVKSSKAENHELKSRIKERISQFEKEADSAIKLLMNVDLSKRKEYEKIKLTVQENLNLYVTHLDRLARELKKLEETDIVSYLSRIFSVLNEFQRASHIPYEKATYLIGKEMAAAKNAVNQFARDISALGEKSKPFFEETKMIGNISASFDELKQSERLEENVKREIAKLHMKIAELDKEHNSIEAEMLSIKESEAYKKDIQEKENHQKKQASLGNELEKIKRGIDFKTLAKIFHHDKKKANIIKDYSTDFKSALKADENLRIIEMAESSQNHNLSSLKELRHSLLMLDLPLALETEARLSSLAEKIKKIESGKALLESTIREENKKQERLAKKKEKTLSELKQLLAHLHISVRD